MEILAVLFFLVVAGGAFFTLLFLSLFLPYWITMQIIEVITNNPKKSVEGQS
ncbi:MAG: hypothetical protein OSB25_01715 [Salibacteraceae bacterium]|nr:hypothetical protein [Salibacteraceae bacterium]|tara:strand:+ start:75520 stop:75675 length:156 start_codon:yes stop_codon:yes gene_type:complete